MGVVNRLLLKGIVLVLTASLLAACGGKEERKAKYLERGKVYMAEKNYEKAKIEFKNVLQIDPKVGEVYQYLGEIAESDQAWRAAYTNYQKAVEFDPELLEARARLARMYLSQAAAMRSQENQDAAANAMGLAQEQISEILKRDPADPEGLTLQASMWVSDGDTDKAMQQLEAVNNREPGLGSAAGLLAALYAQKERQDDAEAVLLKAIDNSDDPLNLQVRLAQLYRTQEKNDLVEDLLQTIIEENPDKLDYRVSLATFLSGIDQKDKAEQVLREAITADPEDVQRYLMLVQFFVDQEDPETAIRTLKGFIQEHPDMTELQFGLAKLYIAGGKKEEAKQVLEQLIKEQGVEPPGLKARNMLAQMLVVEDPESARVVSLTEEVLKENTRDNDALILKGRLAARSGDYTTAINSFRTVLKDQPDSGEILLLLATAHYANDEKELAKDTLSRAIDSNPDDFGLRLNMARFLVDEKDVDGALTQVDEVLKRDQYNENALRLKYELLALKNDAEGMDEVTRLMQAGAPEKEEGYLREARLRYAQKDYDAALKIANTMLDKFPDSVSALRLQSEVFTVQKKYDDGIAVTDRIIDLYPDNAEGYFRKGKLLVAKDQPDAALEQYKLALEKAPDSSDALKEVVALEVRVDGPDTAEQRLKALLAEKPDHPQANRYLAKVYAAKKDFPAAEKSLREQIKLTPDSATYSELAQLRIMQNDLEGAGSAYEEGLAANQDDVSLMIGLAGVHERLGGYEESITLYEKVLAIQPGNAVSVNNLAALLSDHRTDQASLDKAVKMAEILEKTNQPAFLDTAGWIYYRTGDFEKALEILKKVVEKMPDVPVFRYHLGMTYYKLGDKDAARENLTLATGEGSDYVGNEEARATLKSL